MTLFNGDILYLEMIRIIRKIDKKGNNSNYYGHILNLEKIRIIRKIDKKGNDSNYLRYFRCHAYSSFCGSVSFVFNSEKDVGLSNLLSRRRSLCR